MGYFFRKLSLVIIWILAALSMTLAVLTSAYESTLETHQRTIRAALLEELFADEIRALTGA